MLHSIIDLMAQVSVLLHPVVAVDVGEDAGTVGSPQRRNLNIDRLRGYEEKHLINEETGISNEHKISCSPSYPLSHGTAA